MYSIKRHIEPIAERRSKNSKAIALTGPGQVGKSTLFRHIFSDVRQVMGAIICMTDKKIYLRENLVALPLFYL